MDNLTEFLILFVVVILGFVISRIEDRHNNKGNEIGVHNNPIDDLELEVYHKGDGTTFVRVLRKERTTIRYIAFDSNGTLKSSSDGFIFAELDYILKSDDLTDLEKEEIKKAYNFIK